MTENQLRITRRRLLGSIFVIGAGSAAVGSGTLAYFSDTETSSGNSITSGTLDLTLDPTTTFLNKSNIKPGDSGTSTVELANKGSIDGTVEITVSDVTYLENDIVDGEQEYDDTPNTGELQEYVDVRASLGQSFDTGRRPVTEVYEDASLETGVEIPAGDHRDFTLEWWFTDPGDASVNDAQSDSIAIDLTFSLVQS